MKKMVSELFSYLLPPSIFFPLKASSWNVRRFFSLSLSLRLSLIAYCFGAFAYRDKLYWRMSYSSFFMFDFLSFFERGKIHFETFFLLLYPVTKTQYQSERSNVISKRAKSKLLPSGKFRPFLFLSIFIPLSLSLTLSLSLSLS